MATTEFGNDPGTAKIWSTVVMREAIKSTLFKKFTGSIPIRPQGRYKDKLGIIRNHKYGKASKSLVFFNETGPTSTKAKLR